MRLDLQGAPGERALKRAARDPIIRNLLTRQPEEIIQWWTTEATMEEKDRVMLRIVLLVGGLARREIEE